MKKILMYFCCFTALIFVAGCGGGSSKSDKKSNSADTGETVTDEDRVDSDSQSDTEPSGGDTEPTDNPDSDDPDTTPDGSDSAPDNGDTEPDNDADTADTASDQDSDADTGVIEQMDEGIYLGIIGFNYQLNPKPISYLTNSNMTEFQDFIDDFEMDNGTALYYADYKALEMMHDYTPVPQKLQTVALVTFTDGEDTSSDGPENDPENYNDPDVYLNAIHNKIVTNGIHGLPVDAYSIGLRSGDTGSNFKSKLEKLASSSANAFEVSDMEEVQERFTKIAEDLYSVFKTINIDFKVMGGYPDGMRIRFTLDISCDHDENVCEKNGRYSNLYIDATYRRDNNERSFEDFTYHGFSGNLTTVECGERDTKGFYPCRFENLKYDNMDTEIKQIELWKNDNGEWKHENEALKQEDSAINESKSSALIMLVLDCTTSLGSSKFNKLKEAGKDFIETLVNGGSAVTTTPCDDNPCADIANSTGVCTPNGSNYVCGCNSGFDWNGSQCVQPSTPCNPNPCTDITNSNGNCTVSGANYVCGCNLGYNWNSSTSKCDASYCSAVFNGTDSKIEVTSKDLLNFISDSSTIDDWTIEAWIKQEAEDLTSDYATILRKGTSKNLSYVLTGYRTKTQQSGWNGTTTNYVVTGSTTYQAASKTQDLQVDGTFNEYSGGWTHIALVHHKGEENLGPVTTSINFTLTLYVNGKKAGSNIYTDRTGAYDLLTSNENLVIGANLYSNKFFKGLIDSIRISKGEKYTGEFETKKLEKEDDTIAFWDFSGNANDSSENGFNGTATGVTYSTDCAF